MLRKRQTDHWVAVTFVDVPAKRYSRRPARGDRPDVCLQSAIAVAQRAATDLRATAYGSARFA